MFEAELVKQRSLSKNNNSFYLWTTVLFEFLVFSFLGWIVETIDVLIVAGEWTWRGLIAYGLPMIHIYGLGGLIIVYVFGRLRDKPITFFLITTLTMTAFELFSSYFEEALTGLRTWDYSDKLFSFFDGRICLSSSLGWGLLSVFVLYFVHPFLLAFEEKVPRKILYPIVWAVGIYTMICIYIQYF
ncbi:putative ABC transporter permease [Culicoidibacter larvae]|uniref:putative ABC transporter permease n=1 Tax=Culicoidibacter larvae TaxID=2579976 RepID=UPI0014853E7C|nr:putative ABC transporter permease [Culicoidibacter larvae]